MAEVGREGDVDDVAIKPHVRLRRLGTRYEAGSILFLCRTDHTRVRARCPASRRGIEPECVHRRRGRRPRANGGLSIEFSAVECVSDLRRGP